MVPVPDREAVFDPVIDAVTDLDGGTLCETVIDGVLVGVTDADFENEAEIDAVGDPERVIEEFWLIVGLGECEEDRELEGVCVGKGVCV